jgi:hypothetical protein
MSRQQPIHESRLYVFLKQRIPSDKIDKLLLVAERSNMIQRIAGTEQHYIPKARTEFTE